MRVMCIKIGLNESTHSTNVQDREKEEEKNVDGMEHKRKMLKTNRFKFFA